MLEGSVYLCMHVHTTCRLSSACKFAEDGLLKTAATQALLA